MPKTVENPKTHVASCRMTGEVYRAMIADAKKRGVCISDYLETAVMQQIYSDVRAEMENGK